jgi:hypothetical protein
MEERGQRRRRSPEEGEETRVAMVVDETRGGRAAHTPSTHTHRKHV